MTQHGGKAPIVDGLVGVQAVGLQEAHPSLDVTVQPLQSLSSLVQHRRRRVEHRHVVTGVGQRKRLMSRAAADIEHRRGRWWQVLQQLSVHDVGAHVALHRGICLVGEVVDQTRIRPGSFVHPNNATVSS
jgi:hypothetical protein